MAAVLALLFFAVVVAVELWRRSRQAPVKALSHLPAMQVPHNVPQGTFLHDGHTWARLTPDGVLRVGIDAFLADALGEVESVELPPRGRDVLRGEPLFRVKSHGRWLEVLSPSDGRVMLTHGDVESRPWSLSLDPYGVGWAVALRTSDLKGALAPLRTGPQAVAFLRAELQRFVEFVTAGTQVAGQPVLADGAAPAKGSAAGLDNDAWAGFCEQFVARGKRDDKAS